MKGKDPHTSSWGAAELRLAGEMLYGTQEWQSQLARDLMVDSRRVRDWLAGTRRVPDGVWDDIAEIARQRSAALAQLIEDLRAYVPG